MNPNIGPSLELHVEPQRENLSCVQCGDSQNPRYVIKEKLHCGTCIKKSYIEMLDMLKAANYALYVIGKPSAVKDALSGSKDLIWKAEGRNA